MFGYYLQLALVSLRRNVVLTALIIAAVAVGIGTSMTVFTLLRAMSGDPLPHKSAKLFVVQIANWKPTQLKDGEPNVQLSYRDASQIVNAHRALRQTALYAVYFTVTPEDASRLSFRADGLAVHADFLTMFDAPFRHGAPWTAADDERRANVAVIGARLADKLFPGIDPVGRQINLSGRDFAVVGVLEPWEMRPRAYDVVGGRYDETEDVFLPFNTAIALEKETNGNRDCNGIPEPGYQGVLNSECAWIQAWVELPDATAVTGFRQYLNNYAADQQRSGRFQWEPNTRLRNLREWLEFNKVVPSEVSVTTLLAFGFLLVCLVNSIGLMLAKFSARAADLGVRRALGASRRDVFYQCLVETSVVGLAGGVLGLALTALGLAAERAILPEDYARFAHLDGSMVLITIVLAVFATVCSGLYPTWRASRVQPALATQGSIGSAHGNPPHPVRAAPEQSRRGPGHTADRADAGDRLQCALHHPGTTAAHAAAQRHR